MIKTPTAKAPTKPKTPIQEMLLHLSNGREVRFYTNEIVTQHERENLGVTAVVFIDTDDANEVQDKA